MQQMMGGSKKEAETYYKMSCDLGYGGGCGNLANLFKSKDPKKAQELYLEACKKGHSASCLKARGLD